MGSRGPYWGREVLIGVRRSSLGPGGPHWGREVLVGVGGQRPQGFGACTLLKWL